MFKKICHKSGLIDLVNLDNLLLKMGQFKKNLGKYLLILEDVLTKNVKK